MLLRLELQKRRRGAKTKMLPWIGAERDQQVATRLVELCSREQH